MNNIEIILNENAELKRRISWLEANHEKAIALKMPAFNEWWKETIEPLKMNLGGEELYDYVDADWDKIAKHGYNLFKKKYQVKLLAILEGKDKESLTPKSRRGQIGRAHV